MSTLLHGDCLDVLRTLPACSVDSVVTDPPYGLSLMGKAWDYDVPDEAIWRECLRVLKPGGHLLAFAGTRTQHRMAVRIEDAGFEIRDMIAWVYGTGFPKCAKTALKPALEPITVARKPFRGPVAENVLAHGTGALNIDGCRIGTSKNVPASVSQTIERTVYGSFKKAGQTPGVGGHDPSLGRWPANLIHDGSEEVEALFPAVAGGGESGSAARFFYCAKASRRDRGEGNSHPTVKPTKLMRYLVRLVTPPGGTVLDPFMGSGSTGRGAVLEGFDFVGIEREPEYLEIARRRIAEVVLTRGSLL
jgi:site-specific DNA-methyltransferase (adenine-specific)